MSAAENKAIVRRFAVVIFDEKALDRADDVALTDYFDHGAMPGQLPGLQGAKQKVGDVGRGLPRSARVHPPPICRG